MRSISRWHIVVWVLTALLSGALTLAIQPLRHGMLLDSPDPIVAHAWSMPVLRTIATASFRPRSASRKHASVVEQCHIAVGNNGVLIPCLAP